jgi:hypothetical protein
MFKSIQGERMKSLIAALPRVAQWRHSRLPQGLSADEIDLFLGAFDRTSATGRRDYAITRCLLDLGLRRAEVAHLRLDDVDWEAGTLHFCAKVIEADAVIVGIGIIPSTQPLGSAGAAGTNGVLVDAFGSTSLEDVFAVGDCALHRNIHANGTEIRLESVQNATDMASGVARNITGESAPYEALPWFWSHQYDLKLQTIGLSLGHDETVIRGEPASRSFSVAYLREGKGIALDCVNATKDFAQGRALVLGGARFSISALQDTNSPLKIPTSGQ